MVQAGQPLTNFPTTKRQWIKLPFGQMLYELHRRERNFRDHNRQVFDAAHMLYPRLQDRRIITDGDGISADAARRTYRDFLEQARMLCAGLNYPESDRVWAALYHDIGKWLINERHPVIGWHILSDLDPTQRGLLLQQAFGGDDERFRTFRLLIRDHDKFGALSTGEASLPILLPVASYAAGAATVDPVQRARLRATLLMLLNLADIAATPAAQPQKGTVSLKPEKVESLCEDWRAFDEAIQRTKGRRDKLTEEVFELSQAPSSTLERIYRLLRSSTSEHPILQRKITNKHLIEEALEDAFGVRVMDFSEQFAAVVNLDYSLSFFRDLMAHCAKSQPSEDWPEVVATVVAILKRVTETYGRLVMGRGRYEAIVVGFEGLRTPQGAHVKEKIIELLCGRRRERGLAWLMHEVSGWQAVA